MSLVQNRDVRFELRRESRKAQTVVFLTEPLDNHGWEWRCCMRDPDGYLIEVGQYTQPEIDRFKKFAT